MTTTSGARPCRPGMLRQAALVSATLAGLVWGPAVGSAAASSADLLELRAEAGLTPLVRHSGLEVAATRHAEAMAATRVLEHMDQGVAMSYVVEPLVRVAQNVGVGATDEEVIAGMLESQRHRANILGDFDLIGTGRARSADGRLWVSMLFAKLDPGPVVGTAVAPSPTLPPVDPPVAVAVAPAPASPVVAGAPHLVAGPAPKPAPTPAPVALPVASVPGQLDRRPPSIRSTLRWRGWRLAFAEVAWA